MTPIAKVLPEEAVQRLLVASCIGNKFSRKRAEAIEEATLDTKIKYPHLFRPEALPDQSHVHAALDRMADNPREAENV